MQPTLRQAAVATLRHLVERDSVSNSYPVFHLYNMIDEVDGSTGFEQYIILYSLHNQDCLQDQLLTLIFFCAGFFSRRTYRGRSLRNAGFGN